MHFNDVGRDPGPRQSGRTTRLALTFLQKALDNPGTEVEIIDHYDSLKSHMELTRLVHELLDVLQVPHRASIPFNLIKVYPK